MFMGKWTVKFVQISLILIAAAAVVYRGNTYSDPSGMSLLPVVMCGLLATFLALAAVGVLLQERNDGFEAQ